MTSVVAQTRSVSSSKLEALAEELAHLKAAVDMMASSIESMLADIRADVPCEINAPELSDPSTPVAKDENCEQDTGAALACAAPAASMAPPALSTEEADSDAIASAKPAVIETETSVQPICCAGEPARAGGADASPIGIEISAETSSAVDGQGLAVDAVMPPDPPSVPSETSGKIHATTGDMPWHILEQHGKTLAPKPASRVLTGPRWAAAVALIVTLTALAAAGTGFADRRDAELQLADPHQAGLRESAGRPASIVEEMWRLRARSAF